MTYVPPVITYSTDTISPAQLTFTTYSLNMRMELEMIEDRICDLMSGQDSRALFNPGINADGRAIAHRELDRLLKSLRAWRKRYDMEYIAAVGSQTEEP